MNKEKYVIEYLAVIASSNLNIYLISKQVEIGFNNFVFILNKHLKN